MAQVVNLRAARKAKARAGREADAQAARALHGRTKAEKARDAAEAERVRAVVDGAKLESDPA